MHVELFGELVEQPLPLGTLRRGRRAEPPDSCFTRSWSVLMISVTCLSVPSMSLWSARHVATAMPARPGRARRAAPGASRSPRGTTRRRRSPHGNPAIASRQPRRRIASARLACAISIVRRTAGSAGRRSQANHSANGVAPSSRRRIRPLNGFVRAVKQVMSSMTDTSTRSARRTPDSKSGEFVSQVFSNVPDRFGGWRSLTTPAISVARDGARGRERLGGPYNGPHGSCPGVVAGQLT